jgi:hypothetical protein
VINTLHYVQKLTPRDRLHAVIGGLPLGGPRFEPLIGPTCDAFAELAPDFFVPAHCTGCNATPALAARFPEAFLQNPSNPIRLHKYRLPVLPGGRRARDGVVGPEEVVRVVAGLCLLEAVEDVRRIARPGVDRDVDEVGVLDA